MLSKIITSSYYILFFLTPLLFTPYNHELFEYNKMMLVYILTSIIVIFWLFKCLNDRQFFFRRTPLDLPLILFLFSQILSTIFSIDPHTSWWGYYSRSNGGLLSIISYLSLYWVFVSLYSTKEVLSFLKVALISGVVVSLYAIPEHFGVSPSCAILVGRFSVDCWVQDVQARVFATMGQPNWLAAYLAMLIFPNIYFIFNSKTTKQLITYCLSLTALYTAFTFTYSRGATLGLIGGAIVMISLVLIRHPEGIARRIYSSLTLRMTNLILPVITIFLLVTLFFGSSLTGNFRLFVQNIPARPELVSSGASQLESGGTESGQIRLIVWAGALDIFKHYPILGSGVETFAYSYYMFRPVSHNLVSEWDFLYNKAHNEYLNYLATTGILGFGTYLFVIVTFIIWSIKYLVSSIKSKKPDTYYLLLITLLASYISYLIQNTFGFSVVMIALLFYLIPAFVFILAEAETENLPKYLIIPDRITKPVSNFFLRILQIVYQQKLYLNIVKTILALLLIYFVWTVIRFWIADTIFKTGSDYSDAGNSGRAYNYLIHATDLNSGEPLYHSELGFAAANASLALADSDTTRSSQLKTEASNETQIALHLSPENSSLWRTAIRTYFTLTALDSAYASKTLEAVDRSITLAPTDAKLYYNQGIIYSELDQLDQSVTALNKAVQLKPNYKEAYLKLGEVYKTQNNKDLAIQAYQNALKITANDEEALNALKELR